MCGVLSVTGPPPPHPSLPSDYTVECACSQGATACAVERANQSLLSRRGSSEKRAGPEPPIALPLSTRKRRRTTSSLNSPNSSLPGGWGSTNEVSAHSGLMLLPHTSHLSHPHLQPESPSVGVEGDGSSEDTFSSRARKKKVC